MLHKNTGAIFNREPMGSAVHIELTDNDKFRIHYSLPIVMITRGEFYPPPYR